MQQLSADKEKRQSYLLTVVDLKDISYSCQELKQRRIKKGGQGSSRAAALPHQNHTNAESKKKKL